MKSIPRFLPFSLSFLLLVCALGPTHGQEEKKELKVKFHHDLRVANLDHPMLRSFGPTLRWESGGARITLLAGKKEANTPGIATNFKIHGDFEITGAYEILNVDRPAEGYGVGVSLYAAIDPDTNDAISLARRLTKDGNTAFLSNRMKRGAKAPDRVQSRASTALTGALRLKRVGSKIRFLVSEPGTTEFVQMAEEDFDSTDIRFIQFGGNAGNATAGLDLRLLELTVHAEDLPGYEAAQPANPRAPAANAEAVHGVTMSGWLIATILIGGFVVILFGIAAFAGLLLLRRGSAAKT
jgi:hypothetical protein